MAAAGVLLGLSAVAAVAPRSRLNPSGRASMVSGLACLAMVLLGALVLVAGGVVTARAGSVLGLAPVDLRLDALSAFSLVILGVAGAASSVHGVGCWQRRLGR